MIAKSDLVILVLSASALAVGVYRWQANTGMPVVASAPAATTSSSALESPPESTSLLRVAGAIEPVGSEPRPTVSRLGPDAPVDASTTRVLDAPERIVEATLSSAPQGTDAAQDTRAGEPLYGVYQVRSGDYLGRIADRFGTSVASLREINGIRGSTIQIGQEIRYPQAAN